MFQLVLQLTPATDFDELVRLEDRLIDLVGRAAVDGHDLGSNEANIFIWTDHPMSVFHTCLPAIKEAGFLWKFAAGYRALDSDEYIRIWPADDSSPFSVI